MYPFQPLHHPRKLPARFPSSHPTQEESTHPNLLMREATPPWGTASAADSSSNSSVGIGAGDLTESARYEDALLDVDASDAYPLLLLLPDGLRSGEAAGDGDGLRPRASGGGGGGARFFRSEEEEEFRMWRAEAGGVSATAGGGSRSSGEERGRRGRLDFGGACPRHGRNLGGNVRTASSDQIQRLSGTTGEGKRRERWVVVREQAATLTVVNGIRRGSIRLLGSKAFAQQTQITTNTAGPSQLSKAKQYTQR
ncbi:hypothetical protein OF83DRAFT_113106 [Amylostereum chailletii]|nr:hypothetical protein OF83DRAFT_113106 [Amylostereum chailletii]